jgi:hypothetical protein
MPVSGKEIAKILTPKDATPDQIRALDQYFTGLDNVTKRLGGTGDLDIARLTAESGEFSITAPLSTAKLYKDDIAIPNSSATNVGWDSITYNYGGLIDWDSGDSEKIKIKGGNKDRVLLLSVWTKWPNNANGNRYISYIMYDGDDVQLAAYDILSDDSFAGLKYQTFSYPITFDATAEYLTITLYQSSGVELTADVFCGITWLH